MMVLRTISAVATAVALSIVPAWSAPVSFMHRQGRPATLVAAALDGGQSTKLFKPTKQQMKAIQKMLGEQSHAARHAAKPKELLPSRFDGWARGAVRAARPEATHAAALKEFGFKRGEQTSYLHGGGGHTVEVRVLKFQDATGAYGAFTLLRTPGMKRLRVGRREPGVQPAQRTKESKNKVAERPLREHPLTYFNGAHTGGEFLFWKGDLLVTARFAQPVGNEAAVLTHLEEMLPETPGPRGIPPYLPEQLPIEGLDASSVQYAIGPVAYKQEGGKLPSAVMDFATDAEVVRARYGKGTLTLISYPTPQIAVTREAAIASMIKHGDLPGAEAGQRVMRAGPLVAMTSGGYSATEADALLKRVRFQGTVAIDQLKPKESQVVKTAKLLLGIASLTVILGAAAILLGFFLGGGRALYRVMRGKPASTLNDDEFISLELNREPREKKKTGGGED